MPAPASSAVRRFPHLALRRPLSRRHFLRGAGVLLGLPLLESMLPRFARAQAIADAAPRRMFAVLNNLGYLPDNFFPTGAGPDYAPSPYLELLQPHRADFTVFTGVSLPKVDGGFPTDIAWLTGAPNPGSASFRNTISLDQVVARHQGHLTRFGSLTLAVNTRSRSLSVTANGERIQPVESAAELFRLLFVDEPPQELAARIRALETEGSILDTIAGQARAVQGPAGTADRERLDQYFTSVRELEIRVKAAAEWARRPKPVVAMAPPSVPLAPSQYFEKIRLMYDLATLAFATDSTRAITLFIDSISTPPVASALDVPIREGYLSLAHHENIPEKVLQRAALDREHFRLLGGLLHGLKAANEAGGHLLDRTQLLWGSNLHDVSAAPRRMRLPQPVINSIAPQPGPALIQASPPAPPAASAPATPARPTTRPGALTKNLPILFAGGGWKHGKHLVFDRENNYPLTNLHLSMLHRMGIPEERFSTSTGVFEGLEMV
jgi:hypothetical protein